MEKRKNSLSLKAGVKNRKSKDTPIHVHVDAATPRQKGSSGGKGILKCAASNQTNQPLSPLSKSGSYLGNLPQTAEKCPNDSFDFHCSFETDGSSGHGPEADIPCTQPVSQEKILEGVVAFIEARTNTENRFEGISKQMEMLGATVAKKFTLEVTHVVFKDGKKTTRDKALKKGIHLVSVLWVESCRQSGKRVSEDLFPVVLPEEVGTPLMIGKLKRTKSMQPKAFDEDVRNSAERGDRRRRRKVAANNLSPSAMIFCEETQAPYSPLVVSYPLATPHVVPDTPCHSSATAFPFNKALDYEEDSHQETSKPQEPIESNTEEADQSQHSTEEPPVKIAKLKRRLLSNRTPATPATTLTEPTKTPATAKRQTPTDVLLTGSGQGKKRKRVASLNTGESQCVEGKEGLPKEKKKVRLGGHVVVFDGDCLPNAGDGSEKQSVDHEPGASCKNKESLTENPDVKKPTGDVSKNKKTKANGNMTQQRRNRISQGDNDEGASDSGVSVADDTSTASIKDCESKLSKGRFSKTAKLVGQVTEMGDVDELTNLEEHECRKKENTRETTTGAVKKRQIFKPGKLVRQVKEHEAKDTKSKPDGVLEESDKITGNIVAGRKEKVSNIERLESGEERSEDDDNDDDDDEGETCTEDEEQQCVNNVNTTSKTKRDKLVKKLKPKRSIVMTSMHFGEQDIVVSVVRKLGAFFIEDRVSSTTSHVITGSPRRTLNLMMAIAHGCWLVSPTWIMKSLEVGYWVDEEPYELSDAFPAAQLCRLERVSAGPGYNQDLFSDCAPIFVSENCSPPSDSLMTLINLCGGKVCTSVRKAGICIGSMSRRTQAVNITEQWLLDCITQHAVLSFTKYALNSPAKRTRETSPSY